MSGVAFSPDGTLLATASDDNTARIWDTATGTRPAPPSPATPARCTGWRSPPTAPCSPPPPRRHRADLGRGPPAHPAPPSPATTARCAGWRSPPTAPCSPPPPRRHRADLGTATGTTRTTLTGHTGAVKGVAFSPDGTLLATASNDSTARIWDAATGTTRATLHRPHQPGNGRGVLPRRHPARHRLRRWHHPDLGRHRSLPGHLHRSLTRQWLRHDNDLRRLQTRGRSGRPALVGDEAVPVRPGELDGYVPGLRRVPAEERLPLLGGAGNLPR